MRWAHLLVYTWDGRVIVLRYETRCVVVCRCLLTRWLRGVTLSLGPLHGDGVGGCLPLGAGQSERLRAALIAPVTRGGLPTLRLYAPHEAVYLHAQPEALQPCGSGWCLYSTATTSQGSPTRNAIRDAAAGLSSRPFSAAECTFLNWCLGR